MNKVGVFDLVLCMKTLCLVVLTIVLGMCLWIDIGLWHFGSIARGVC